MSADKTKDPTPHPAAVEQGVGTVEQHAGWPSLRARCPTLMSVLDRVPGPLTPDAKRIHPSLYHALVEELSALERLSTRVEPTKSEVDRVDGMAGVEYATDTTREALRKALAGLLASICPRCDTSLEWAERVEAERDTARKRAFDIADQCNAAAALWARREAATKAEIDHLRTVIEGAPHPDTCGVERARRAGGGTAGPCTCWKATALKGGGL